MNKQILKKHKARTWLNIIAGIDMLVITAIFALMQITKSYEVIYSPALLTFIGVLVMTNMWFTVDYLYTCASLRRESFKRDYKERQIRFAFVCHVFDPAGSKETIYLSKFAGARDWFYKKMGVSKSDRDEIAVCLTSIDGCYKSDLSFSDNLKKYMEGHPIENVYYTDIKYSNEQFPYVQTSKRFSEKREDGITLIFVCETSMDFYETEVEERMRNCLYNQEKTVYPLTKIFETSDMKNRLSVKLEFHRLDID